MTALEHYITIAPLNIEENDEPKFSVSDIPKVKLVTCIQEGERIISGDTRIQRLKSAGFQRLGERALILFLKNPHLIPEEWKMVNEHGGPRCVHFDGFVLTLRTFRTSPYLRFADGEWKAGRCLPDMGAHLSAVLPVEEMGAG